MTPERFQIQSDGRSELCLSCRVGNKIPDACKSTVAGLGEPNARKPPTLPGAYVHRICKILHEETTALNEPQQGAGCCDPRIDRYLHRRWLSFHDLRNVRMLLALRLCRFLGIVVIGLVQALS